MKKRKDDLCYRLAIAFCMKFFPFMPWVKKAKAQKEKKVWRYISKKKIEPETTQEKDYGDWKITIPKRQDPSLKPYTPVNLYRMRQNTAPKAE